MNSKNHTQTGGQLAGDKSAHAGTHAVETAPLAQLPGITQSDLKRLEELGLKTQSDLLLYLPSEWQDRTSITSISDLIPGTPGQVQGRVTRVYQPRGRRMLSVQITDGTGILEMLFFRFTYPQVQRLKNATVRCFGEVKPVRGRGMRMIHPRYNILPENTPPPPLSSHLTPLYPHSGGTAGQKQLQKLIDLCLDQCASTPNALADPVTPLLDQQDPSPSLLQALNLLHHTPPDTADIENQRATARARLALDEVVADMLGQMQAGKRLRNHPAHPLQPCDELTPRLIAALPFQLTQAQLRVNKEIADDMSTGTPMLRLLQGDVGSGKTLVGVCAALRAIGSGCQVALMAPTEVLVEQHLYNLRNWLTPLGIDPAALTSSSSAAARRTILTALRDGTLKLIVGTHALFEDEVQFKDLALVIVDEQHRFGVHQRLRLVQRGQGLLCPHQLTMTATPIPRTLAMTRYAEMDVSVLDEMPPDRQPVQTTRHPEKDRDRIIQRIGQRCQQGERAFWVCAMIEESEQLKARAATLVCEELREKLPEVPIGIIHGRMKSAEKSAAMEDFKQGKTLLLVATTVIEVGMDVPEATMMSVENPERFGLAQLHQLRGRVGRSKQQSYCVLLHGSDISHMALQRLTTLCEHQDGFSIAEEDLRLRGPGELLGVRQAGGAEYRIFDYQTHQELLPSARRIAQKLLKDDNPDSERMQARWRRLEYARV